MEKIYFFSGTVAQLRSHLDSGLTRFMDDVGRKAHRLDLMIKGEIDPLEEPYHDDR